MKLDHLSGASWPAQSLRGGHQDPLWEKCLSTARKSVYKLQSTSLVSKDRWSGCNGNLINWYWWRIILIDIKIEDFELNWIDLITFRSRWRTWFECRYSTARSNWTNHLQSLYWYHHIQQPPIRSALAIMTQMSSTSDREDGLRKLEKWSHLFKIFTISVSFNFPVVCLSSLDEPMAPSAVNDSFWAISRLWKKMYQFYGGLSTCLFIKVLAMSFTQKIGPETLQHLMSLQFAPTK